MDLKKHLIFGAISLGVLFVALVEVTSLYSTLGDVNVSKI